MGSIKISGALVREMRERKGWSQEQLAAVAGVSARTIQRVAQLGNASLETRMAVASALAVAHEALMVGDAGCKPAATEPGTAHAQPDLTWLHMIGAIIVLLMLLFNFGFRIGTDLALRVNAQECPITSACSGRGG